MTNLSNGSSNGSSTAGAGGPRAYSRAEKVADAALHITGVASALLAVPVIVILAAVWHGDVPTVTAAAIYGASMIAMFLASACYHMVSAEEWRGLLRRLDHSAIYLKIAGTYTPFAVLLGGEDSGLILAGIWAAALLGMTLKVVAPERFEWLALGLYLAMGWAVVIIGQPILVGMSMASWILLLVGGGLYTLGIVFYLWDRLPFQNAIWHGHVLAASFVFYAAILIEVAVTAPA